MMIQKIRFLISINSQYIITTLKLNLTHYEHSPINIGGVVRVDFGFTHPHVRGLVGPLVAADDIVLRRNERISL